MLDRTIVFWIGIMVATATFAYVENLVTYPLFKVTSSWVGLGFREGLIIFLLGLGCIMSAKRLGGERLALVSLVLGFSLIIMGSLQFERYDPDTIFEGIWHVGLSGPRITSIGLILIDLCGLALVLTGTHRFVKLRISPSQ